MSKKHDTDTVLRGLRPERRRAGMSQARLAGAADVPASKLSQYETGKALPSARTLVRLADALGCTIDVLFGLGSFGPERLAFISSEALLAEVGRRMGDAG